MELDNRHIRITHSTGKAFVRATHSTWVEKYRPRRLVDIIGHDEVKSMLHASIKNDNLPHLLFYGAPGTGKTSSAIALVMQLYGARGIEDKVLELNASDENGINVVREKIIRFANIVVGSTGNEPIGNDTHTTTSSFKTVILDEADSMTSEAQTALKKVMESTCDITRFIFICNYENKIIEAIRSRCASFRFNPIPSKLMIRKLKLIASREKIHIMPDVFETITGLCQGDARRSINMLQNIKYLPSKLVTRSDVYQMTSYIDCHYFDAMWDTIVCATAQQLSDIVTELLNQGYPINYVLNALKDQVIGSTFTSDIKARILVYMGKIERIIVSGSDNYIQLLAVFAYINGHANQANRLVEPSIY
jgi:replication factor C subunit 2/4